MQLKVTAALNLPPEYTHAYLEAHGTAKHSPTWTSPSVPVHDGTAMLDMWARFAEDTTYFVLTVSG